MKKNKSEETPSHKNSRSVPGSIDLYTIQCDTCFKWRVLRTQEEFEELRSKLPDEPYHCNKVPGVSCEDPGDIEYDATRTWIMENHNVPKSPKGFTRMVVLRKDFSRLDSYYLSPTGKRLRSLSEITAYLQEYPEYKGISLSNFSFQTPKVMDTTIPEDVHEKASDNRNKKAKSSEQVDA